MEDPSTPPTLRRGSVGMTNNVKLVMKKKLLIIFFLIFLGIIICLLLIFLFYKKEKITGSKNIQKSQTADLDKDGNLEKYNLQNGRLKVTKDAKLIWETSAVWWVDDFVLADSNNDGTSDINLSVWKKGDFGPDMPFWVKENDQSVKNHFFIFDLTRDGVQPVWQSSNLETPNCEFHFDDVDRDGKQELVTAEGVYTASHACKGEHTGIWKWNGWGFSNIRRSEM